MRRIKLVLGALVVMVASFVAVSGPAMAQDNYRNDRSNQMAEYNQWNAGGYNHQDDGGYNYWNQDDGGYTNYWNPYYYSGYTNYWNPFYYGVYNVFEEF